MIREVNSEIITAAVAEMCVKANCIIAPEIKAAIERSRLAEKSEVGRTVLSNLLENADIAEKKMMPICQDTGMAVFFIEIGKDVHIIGKNLTDAVNDGVRKGYTEGYLRKSVVKDPLFRDNTGDNTPAVIYTEQTDGDKIKITYAPKGFGSENKSAVKMLNPSDGEQGIIDFVTETVRKAGANPCPPMVVGVGIGGTMDYAAYLAKKALTRSIDTENGIKYYADMEKALLERINLLGIGPQGMGGTTTALGVNIEVFPTHIAGLPVAVNINCHATRHSEVVI